jgi:hypothetical protein
MQHPLARPLPTSLLIALAACLAAALVATPAPRADAVDPALRYVWTYQAATHQLVGPPGTYPFAIQGGTPVVDAEGTPAVKFTTPTSLGTYSAAASTFYRPGTEDFAWQAVMSLDYLRPKSTANVAQYGLWAGAQIKLQIGRTGVPECHFNGSNGRTKVAATAYGSINDGGRKHTFTCWRDGSVLGVTVDCVSDTTTFDLGAVSPTTKPTFGNRGPKGGAEDQLYGTFWSYGVSIGPEASPPACP